MAGMAKSGLAAMLLAAAIGTGHAAHATQPYLAEVRTFALHECPPGWLPTDGQLLQNEHYPLLEAELTDRFGSTGRRNFAVPKLTPPNGAPGKPELYCISAHGIDPTRPAPAYSDHYIGDIRLFATERCPRDWLKTDGSNYASRFYVALSVIIGHRYGGGGNFFQVPNNPRVVAQGNVELNECIAATGIFPIAN